MFRPTTIERAFELARSGQVENIDVLEAQLTREGYWAVREHLAGHQIKRQIREIIKEARTSAPLLSM